LVADHQSGPRFFWNKLLGTATSASWATSVNWNVTYRPWSTTFAPIFTNFSRSVVSDQCSTSFGKASVRMKSASIVGQGVKLEPNLVVAELASRHSGPLDGVLAFLDGLLRFTSSIVEGHHAPLPVPASGLIAELA